MKWGTGKWGSGKWGWNDGASSQDILERKVLGTDVPWLDNNLVPNRNACAELWVVDPDTWVDTIKIPCTFMRTSEIPDNIFQQDTLNITIDDASGDYLPGGAHVADIAINNFVRPKWTISNAAGTIVRRGNIYRIMSNPARSKQSAGFAPIQLTAQDWMRYKLDQQIGGGLSPLLWAIEQKQQILEDGSPPVINGFDTWSTVVSALLYDLSEHRLVVDAGTFSAARHPSIEADPVTFEIPALHMQDPLTTDALARTLTYRALLTALSSEITAPFKMVYDDSGIPHMMSARDRRASNLVISCDSNFGGGLPVPYESIQRTPSRPDYTRVQFWYIVTLPVDKPSKVTTTSKTDADTAETGAGIPAFYTSMTLYGEKSSWSDINPDLPPLSNTKLIQDRGEILTSLIADPLENTDYGLPTNQLVDAYLVGQLQKTLGKADRISISVDSAFPPCRLGDWILVNVARVASGWWALTQIMQPSGLEAATWTMEWRDRIPNAPD